MSVIGKSSIALRCQLCRAKRSVLPRRLSEFLQVLPQRSEDVLLEPDGFQGTGLVVMLLRGGQGRVPQDLRDDAHMLRVLAHNRFGSVVPEEVRVHRLPEGRPGAARDLKPDRIRAYHPATRGDPQRLRRRPVPAGHRIAREQHRSVVLKVELERRRQLPEMASPSIAAFDVIGPEA